MSENEMPQLESKVSLVGKAELPRFDRDVVQSYAREWEDEFQGLYEISAFAEGLALIKPPYNFRQLESISQNNNSIQPCVDAMITNVDGTGHFVGAKDESRTAELEGVIREVNDFFDQVYPGMSFMKLRKELRKDLETTGNAYIEVLRNIRGEMVFMRNLDPKLMRLVRLDKARIKTVMVRGVEVKITVRERRYAQYLSGNRIFFKEFGAERQLHRKLGEWDDDVDVPFNERANEVIHLRLKKDVDTPYGVPRWITQTPSALGSRKAEEHNLEFFNSGGIPPVLILVQGGALSENAVTAIQEHMDGTSKQKHRAAVVEAHSTSGSLDSTNNVKVAVEKFGAEVVKDSMYEAYDDKCEKRVRRSFRLPSLFVGDSANMNYASAYTAYTIGEAQVFKPERDDFDSFINLKIMPEILEEEHVGEVIFRSKPLAVKDATQRLRGIEILADKGALRKGELIEAMNETVALGVTIREDERDDELELLTSNKTIREGEYTGRGRKQQQETSKDDRSVPTFEIVQ